MPSTKKKKFKRPAGNRAHLYGWRPEVANVQTLEEVVGELRTMTSPFEDGDRRSMQMLQDKIQNL
jgi:hypothetical protein